MILPGSASISEQDVNVVCRFGNFVHQVLHTFKLGAVGWYGDGFCARGKVWKGIEGLDSSIAGVRFARRNIHFRRSSLEKSASCVSYERRKGPRRGNSYPDAAWRPRPLEPPVTTTTFPLREKMLGKS